MGPQKFRPPKSSMGSYFQQKIHKKRRFFEFGAVVGLWGGPHIQKFLATHFGGIVAEKQHLLFLLPKIDDFMNIWKKPAPQMKIEFCHKGETEISMEISARGPPTNMLPICNIT